MKSYAIGQGTLLVERGDITVSDAQAIVNAANPRLAGGRGVDGAIHKAAGPGLLEACQEIVQDMGPLPPGEAVITPGFDLPAQWVIHTVGPVWRGGKEGERATLTSAYRRSLEVAEEQGVETVAFPAVSCGAYGYPLGEAAAVALDVLAQGLQEGMVREAAMVLFGESVYQAFADAASVRLG
ncbi:MAG: O-acetyl-ADP-ribose deacetylase [Desulfovibrionaceae bacterium]